MNDLGAENESQIDQRIVEKVSVLRKQAIFAHGKIIDETGGTYGIRDQALLESAIAAPYATFFGEDLHQSVFDKAAALMRSLSVNHPFNDGNKRTSLVMTASFLFEHGYSIKDSVNDDELVDLCIDVAKGEQRVEEISSWLAGNANRASAKSFRSVIEKLYDF